MMHRLVARLFLVLLCSSLAMAAQGVAAPSAPDAQPNADAVDDRSVPIATTLKVLTYNVFMRPPPLPGNQDYRAPLIPGALVGYDVIIFEEMFSNGHRETILSGLAADYPYQTHVLGRDGRPLPIDQDGGVVIISKWPIVREFQRSFSDLCVSEDCRADKGVLYARIDWSGSPVHVFGTHTQAGDTPERRQTREAQIINMRFLIESMSIPADQPVLIAGDLNVDLYVNDEYQTMLGILSATHPAPQSGVRGYTSHPDNEYIDDANQAKYLDYVLYADKHLRPDSAYNDVRIVKVDGRDMSDHYAVEGNFQFTGMGREPSAFPFAAFYTENGAPRQDFHCTVAMEREKEIPFGYPEECDNDEVRSLVLYDMPAGHVLRLYDNSDGNRDDDWVEILAKRDIAEKAIASFEQSFEDADVLVTYYYVNGLDGKVSRLEVDFCETHCGPVSILSHKDGGTVPAASSLVVEVWAQLGVSNVQLYVDNAAQPFESHDGGSAWSFRWNVPPEVDRTYALEAFGWIGGNQVSSGVATVTATAPLNVTFEAPDPEQPVPIGQPVTVIVDAPAATASVDLQVSPGDADGGGPMVRNPSSGKWQYDWTPQPPGGIEFQSYTLRAVAYDIYNVLLSDAQLQVNAEGTNPAEPRIVVPPLAFAGSLVTVIVAAPGADSVTLTIDGSSVPLTQQASNWIFEWQPSVGRYRLQAFANYGGVVKSTERFLEVVAKPDIAITDINPYAIKAQIPEFTPHAALYFGGAVPTGIPTTQFACGVSGFGSRGGDIGERIDFGDSAIGILDIVGVYPIAGASDWHAFADFNTLHQGWDVWPVLRDIGYQDRPEKWWLNFLCVTKNVASFHTFSRIGDNTDKDTGIRYDEKVCAIAGFRADEGDINENGKHSIIQNYLERRGDTWRIRADFATHNGDKGGHEDWTVHLLCLDESVASLDGPVAGKSFFVEEFTNLGDDVGAGREFSIGYSVDDYECGIAGFAAHDGDIDEHDKSGGSNLFSTYMYPKNGTWHVRADFRSHKDHENWNVNVLCAVRGDADLSRNISIEATGIGNCMAEGAKCQILRDESIDLEGLVSVAGGGYTGDPFYRGTACSTNNQIEVYVDDRDPQTGKPRWSYPPDLCVVHGQNLTLDPGRTYDLRGTSLIGGATVPIELQAGAALAPVIHGAAATLFPHPWGPGVALTWEPAASPQAVYYEIQFAAAGGGWQIYTDSRDIAWGGWINHHGNLACGDGYTLCLPSARQFSYRVRVLNGARTPISGWSNVITATSMDWTGLAPPNRAPVITAPSDWSVFAKDTVSFTVAASDADGDRVQILADNLPDGAQLAPTEGTGSVTATFSWRPGPGDEGVHTITFTVKDPDGAMSSKVTSINVCSQDERHCFF